MWENFECMFDLSKENNLFKEMQISMTSKAANRLKKELTSSDMQCKSLLKRKTLKNVDFWDFSPLDAQRKLLNSR